MAKIDNIFKKETKQAENHPKRVTKWIHYSKLKDNKDQYCNERDKEELTALADLIEADGEVLQDLLVRKIGTDEYEIIAGHKRRRACKILVEERGKEAFALLPCFVKDVSDVRAEFQLYSSNNYHEKSEYERMHELERMKYLLENYPDEFPQVEQKGRMVDRLAKLLNTNKSTVGEYLTIANNLGDKGMEKFKSGELKKSAAVQMSSLPEPEQEQLIETGKITISEIKKHKEQKIELAKVTTVKAEKEKPASDQPEEDAIDGQYRIADVECNIAEDKKEVVPDFGTLPDLKNMDEREEFVNNYRRWDIWCRNDFTEETFYRYDLPDGSAIIVKQYPYTDHWNPKVERTGTSLYLMLPEMRHFKNAESNMTEIKEHLKNLRKKR